MFSGIVACDCEIIGGHDVSGHVDCRAEVVLLEELEESRSIRFRVPSNKTRYLFPQGYVAINGVSLTVADLRRDSSEFGVWLIPETLRRTNLRLLEVGNLVNIEFHRGVQVVVDTIESSVRDFLSESLRRGELGEESLKSLFSIQQYLLGKRATKNPRNIALGSGKINTRMYEL
jgi:riboflavin synthase alpha subunit